jgi:hypothetical protein
MKACGCGVLLLVMVVFSHKKGAEVIAQDLIAIKQQG